MSDFRITVADAAAIIITLRSDPTPTTRALLAAVPFVSSANRWGDEVYFEVPFHVELERDARQDMQVSDVAFWPDGDALAVFFGPTPVSIGRAPRAYSPCNVVGTVKGDASTLKDVCSGDKVIVELV